MRLQLALNVSNLDEAVDFYTRMFGVGPPRRSPATPTSRSSTRPSSWCCSRTPASRGASTTSVSRPRRPTRSSPPNPARRGRARRRSRRHRVLLRREDRDVGSGPRSTARRRVVEWYVKTADVEQLVNTIDRPLDGCGPHRHGQRWRTCCPGLTPDPELGSAVEPRPLEADRHRNDLCRRPARPARPANVNVSGLIAKCWVSAWTSRSRRCSGFSSRIELPPPVGVGHVDHRRRRTQTAHVVAARNRARCSSVKSARSRRRLPRRGRLAVHERPRRAAPHRPHRGGCGTAGCAANGSIANAGTLAVAIARDVVERALRDADRDGREHQRRQRQLGHRITGASIAE